MTARRHVVSCPHCVYSVERSKRAAALHIMSQHVAYEHGKPYAASNLDANQAPVVESEPQPSPAQDRRPATSQQETQPIEIQVEAQLAEEIATLRVRLDQADTRTFDLQAKYDTAQTQADKARSEVKKAELQKTADRLHDQLLKSLGFGKDLSEKIRNLQHPSTLERKVQEKVTTTERIGKMTSTASKTKKQTAADLGVPKQYLGAAGTFKPGMDARCKSDLILAILEQPAPNALVKFSKADAEKLFSQFPQWKVFLDRKRELVAAKAEAATAKRTEKTAAAKTAAAAKTSAAKPQAKPNPKPASTKKSGGRKVGGRSSKK